MTTIKDVLSSLEDDFLNFDLSEITEVLSTLQSDIPVDLAQAENMQRLSLRATDVLSEYLVKIIKIIGVLESNLNRKKNEILLTYEAPKGKTTADMRKAASESNEEVEEISNKISKAKAAKIYLDKKYDIVMKTHYYYRDVAEGYKRTIVGQTRTNNTGTNEVEGWG